MGACEHFRYVFLFMHLNEKLSLVLRANMNAMNIYNPSFLLVFPRIVPVFHAPLVNAREIDVKNII